VRHQPSSTIQTGISAVQRETFSGPERNIFLVLRNNDVSTRFFHGSNILRKEDCILCQMEMHSQKQNDEVSRSNRSSNNDDSKTNNAESEVSGDILKEADWVMIPDMDKDDFNLFVPATEIRDGAKNQSGETLEAKKSISEAEAEAEAEDFFKGIFEGYGTKKDKDAEMILREANFQRMYDSIRKESEGKREKNNNVTFADNIANKATFAHANRATNAQQPPKNKQSHAHHHSDTKNNNNNGNHYGHDDDNDNNDNASKPPLKIVNHPHEKMGLGYWGGAFYTRGAPPPPHTPPLSSHSSPSFFIPPLPPPPSSSTPGGSGGGGTEDRRDLVVPFLAAAMLLGGVAFYRCSSSSQNQTCYALEEEAKKKEGKAKKKKKKKHKEEMDEC